MCTCINCECKANCGSQNPDKLVGKEADAAGVTDFTSKWYCDTSCSCCQDVRDEHPNEDF